MSGNNNQKPFFRRDTASSLLPRGLVLGFILVTALIGFEIFNFSTTQVALEDFLGSLTFAGIPWATILAIAFCGIDFAGIARLFTPESGQPSTQETWYLLGAWFLAASMNAVLTWWGVSLGLVNRTLQSSAFISPGTLDKVVPIFIALLVWLTRILLIGSFSIAGPGFFGLPEVVRQRPATLRDVAPTPAPNYNSRPIATSRVAQLRSVSRPVETPLPRPTPSPPRPEPEYVNDPNCASFTPVYQTLSGKSGQSGQARNF